MPQVAENTETKPAQRKAVGAPPRKAADVLLPKTDKKGTPSKWKPGGRLAKLAVPEGYRGRWCHKDAINIQQKMEEGWGLVNKTTAPSARQEGNDAPDAAYDGKALESAVQYRDMVGMMLPIEDVNGDGLCVSERRKWIQEENERLLRSHVNLGKAKSAGDAGLVAAARLKPSLTIE